jgi:outer membrane protein assembly factor BamA
LKDNDFISIPIPKKLFEKISREIRNTSLEAVSKYITYLLERELSSEEKQVYSEEEKKKVKERLHNLGYF